MKSKDVRTGQNTKKVVKDGNGAVHHEGGNTTPRILYLIVRLASLILS